MSRKYDSDVIGFSTEHSAKSRSIGAQAEVSPTLRAGVVPAITFRKTTHPHNAEEAQGFEETDINDTLNLHDNGEIRTPTLIVETRINRNSNARSFNGGNSVLATKD